MEGASWADGQLAVTDELSVAAAQAGEGEGPALSMTKRNQGRKRRAWANWANWARNRGLGGTWVKCGEALPDAWLRWVHVDSAEPGSRKTALKKGPAQAAQAALKGVPAAVMMSEVQADRGLLTSAGLPEHQPKPPRRHLTSEGSEQE